MYGLGVSGCSAERLLYAAHLVDGVVLSVGAMRCPASGIAYCSFVRDSFLPAAHLRAKLSLVSVPLTRTQQGVSEVVSWLQDIFRYRSAAADPDTRDEPAVV